MLSFFKAVLKILTVFALILCYNGVFGSQAGVKTEKLKKKAEDINRKIEENKNKLKKFKKKEVSVINKLNKTGMALNKAGKKVSALKSEITAIEKKIMSTETETDNLVEQIQISEKYASRRMAALYKLNCLGKMRILASAASINDFFHRKMSLERILAHDKSTLKNFADKKKQLLALLNRLDTRKNKKLSLEAAYKKQISIMSRERTRRSKLLAGVRNEKSLALAAIKSLKQAAKELDKKIKALNKKSEQLKMGQSKFYSLKGLLKMPVKGKIISYFGSYTNPEFNVKNFRSGIDIKADKGSPIRAVCVGQVLFSSWFKGYGNMLIIDHGDNYYTLYAHADKLLKSEGEHVEADEVIATVGDTGSINGSVLHFEVRHHGKPLDPVKWLKKG
ncbi:MAG: peptidoglycan DD-metalloendopeptidase family protein [Desulfobacterales bacterium]|nr:peptidoglycan DD-metalloendopeptidase family protein [Desulfobacterales bacterium]